MSAIDGVFRGMKRPPPPPRDKVAAILASLFPKQRAFVEDPARRGALRTPRRSGKTFGAGAKFTLVCLLKDGANCLFVAKTQRAARRILWKELRKLNRTHELGIEFNKTDGTAVFPNGSTIALSGASSAEHVEAARGDGYDLVICDECASYDPEVFEYLLEDVIEPALLDADGALWTIGTPGAVLMGRFYDTTGPVAFLPSLNEDGEQRPPRSRDYSERSLPQWQGDGTFEYSFHAWGLADNTARPGAWDRALRLKKRKGWTDQTPKWRREYLGEWCSDASEFCYPYDDERNGWVDGDELEDGARIAVAHLPAGHDWRFLCGVDPGRVNRCAVQVGAYADTHPWFFQVYEYSRAGMSGSEMSAAIQLAEKRVCGSRTFDATVMDSDGGGSAMLAETVNRDFGVSTQAAKKSEKREHMELVVGDLLDGRMKWMRKSRLAYEAKTVVWDDPLTKRREKRDQANDNLDAWLYLRRHALHWLAVAPAIPPEPGTAAHTAQLERARLDLDNEELAASQRRVEADADVGDGNGDPWHYENGDGW